MLNIRPGTTAVLELLFASGIWGFGFVATVYALESFDAISISVLRYAIAFVLGCLILSVSSRGLSGVRGELKRSLGPGAALAVTLNLQTWGLEYTTATKSGFITTLYVVIVPVMELLFYKTKLHRLHWVWVTVALIGTALMVQLHSAAMSVGDVMTLVAAVTASVQILWISAITAEVKSPFDFNVAQSFWGAVVSLPFYLIYGQMYYHEGSERGWFGLLWLAIGSTLIGFALQLRAQRHLPASFSSLLFLLESPMAMIFAYWLLAERLSDLQMLGATLIFASAALAIISEQIVRKPGGA